MEVAADGTVDVQISQQHPPERHWVNDLLDVVNFNFSQNARLVYFCVSCSRGPFQARDFMQSGGHFRHDYLEVHEHQNSLSVQGRDMAVRGVSPDLVQMYVHMSDPEKYFLFLHNTFGYATPTTVPCVACVHCRTQILFVRDRGQNSQSRFCCLNCRIEFEAEKLKGVMSTKIADEPGLARKDGKVQRSISLLPSHLVGQPAQSPACSCADKQLPDHYRSLEANKDLNMRQAVGNIDSLRREFQQCEGNITWFSNATN